MVSRIRNVMLAPSPTSTLFCLFCSCKTVVLCFLSLSSFLFFLFQMIMPGSLCMFHPDSRSC